LDRISREVETIADFESYLFDLVKVIRDSLARQYDALLAQVVLGVYPRYSIRHAVDTAILVEAMGIESGQPVGIRNAMTCAALTMNISMLEMQDKLREIPGELPDAVLSMMKEHPKRSVGILRKAGVSNLSWLNAVEQHHERLDGGGYPNGLSDRSISLESQFVAAADVLLARMAPAAYKEAETPAKAFWGTYESRGIQIRQDALTAAIKAMGLYPPGTLVRLANYDLAVVVARGKEISKPIAASIIGERGLVLPSPMLRDTANEDYAVVTVVDPERAGLKINTEVLWPG
jgi:HD-GYP domain-containing protein (c-di-GMP phosphodiesterase class II)